VQVSGQAKRLTTAKQEGMNMTKTGERFTNGKDILTVLNVLPSGRFYYQMNWQDRSSKYATGINWVLKNYPTKIEE
jgi:hypothetical protein